MSGLFSARCAVVQCALLLITGLDHAAVGVSLLVVGVRGWAIITAVTVPGVRQPTTRPRSWNLTRLVSGQIASVPVVSAVSC